MYKTLVDFIVPVAAASAFIEETLSSIQKSINASWKPWLYKTLFVDNAIPGISAQTEPKNLALIYGAEYVRLEASLPILEN